MIYNVFYTNNQDQVNIGIYQTENTAQEAVIQLRKINIKAFYFSNGHETRKDKKQFYHDIIDRKYNFSSTRQLTLLNFMGK